MINLIITEINQKLHYNKSLKTMPNNSKLLVNSFLILLTKIYRLKEINFK